MQKHNLKILTFFSDMQHNQKLIVNDEWNGMEWFSNYLYENQAQLLSVITEQ